MRRREGRNRVAAAGFATLLVLLISMTAAAPAWADFGLEKFDVTFTNQDGTPAEQAGSHPFAMTTSFTLNNSGSDVDSEIRNLVVEQIPGLVGDATAMPRCATAEFVNPPNAESECPNSTAVGVVGIALNSPFSFYSVPVYNLEPPPGVPVRIGFVLLGVPTTVDVGVKKAPDYNVEASIVHISQVLEVFGSQLTLWGNPAAPVHDPLRGHCLALEAGFLEPAFVSLGECPASLNDPKPFLTLPGSCTGPAATTYSIDSWQNPGVFVSGSSLTHDDAEPPNPLGFSGCEALPFTPQVSARPSTTSAESPTGLDFDLDFDQEGLTSEDGLAQSALKKAVVTLPEGVTINPSVGEGLGYCSPADYERESLDAAPGQGCPDSSTIGTVHVDSPLLDEGIDGTLYLAQQDDPGTTAHGAENPFDSLIAVYIVLRNPSQGILVKIPLKVEPDPKTGQLITTAEDLPQLPFSHFNLHFREGKRSPLVSPPACGSYDTVAKLTPWSDPASVRTLVSSFEVTGGIGQGPCPPGGVPPFGPDFEAGSINNNAKAFSPFDMRLIRHDGEQDMTKFSSTLPPGVLGKLAGVDKCSDSAIAAAAAKTGREELASPSCPANSQIGHILAGAGVGPALTYVGGKIYLGGAYHGDPLSVVVITPAVAGPFDAGTVVTREALTLNPDTAEVEVDGAASDPIPHILKGIPLKVRDLQIYVDRPDFILNPTSCDPSSARATLFGSYLDVFSPSDDVPVKLSTRYQAANCLNLGFKPRLSLKLSGGARRGDHPALRAVVKARPGDANFGSAVVTLPRSAFLDQSHIRTICTRVQFAVEACPKGSIYGHAKAITPLLDEPVEGPVYLRSSNHKLPDLVAALHGIVDVNVVGRIDSFRGGIRSSFETIPDAPVSKFVLTMQGGSKGLVVNSRNLCAGRNRAAARFVGQNGRPYDFTPVVKPSCGGKRKR
jgi:hypothetical protein